MPPLTTSRLTNGVLVLQSRLWATNSVIVEAGRACLVCDPSIFPEEVAEIRALTRSAAEVHLLVTHSDYDHVCGLPAFADGATVVAGASTAAAIADGTARRKLDEGAHEWGAAWDGELRVDVVASVGPVYCGEAEVVALDCPGHSNDGSAFVILGRRLLLAGDYLSAVCPPIVLFDFDRTVSSIERLLAAIEDHTITTTVPGHGPVLDRDQARRIGREDIRYLRALQERAAAAVQEGLSPGAAFLAVRAVVQPRAARADFEAFDWLGANARRALAEAGHPGFAAGEAAVTR